MRRSDFQDMLPRSVGRSGSRRDVLRQLDATGLIAAPPPISSELLTGSSGGAGNVLGGLLQDPAKNITEQAAELIRQVTDLRSTQQTQIDTLKDNTQAVTQNTTSKAGGASVGSTVGKIASGFLGGGFGLSPIVSGLLSLFGGSKSPTVSPLVPFTLPAPSQYQGGLTGGPGRQAVPVDYGQFGQVRSLAASSASQVSIQVNAMDSRSFLDHSDEIARAVREAMLHADSLNDVISDL